MSDGARLTLPQAGLVALVLAAVFAGALWLASRSNRKGARAFEAFGQSRGWIYTRTDTQGLAAKLEALIPAERYTFDNLLTAEEPGRKLVLFECGYRRADLQRVRSFGTGCFIGGPGFGSLKSPVEVIGRNWADSALLGGKVALGQPEFDKAFIVLASDPSAAREALSPALQTRLLVHAAGPLFNPVRVVMGPSGAVVLTGYPADPSRWNDLVGLARGIQECLEKGRPTG